MSQSSRPVEPVRPDGVELVFFYQCPFCNRTVPLIAPTQPSMAQCDSCMQPFPIVPVDERTVRYLKVMLDNGRAAVDPDFV
ncbi:hypothetical protein [Nitratidesulfovibrio vulgaris]|uniref:Uncharacterized protein n=2 Tax=Nitratidesulfovibrio vulgaris TaxID=881 RepID=Q72BL5_NITV2|nr:hypothetical protein [Nitratidesulfovibrio vulgaris]GEB79348.1 hypothetical protein DDE01_07630 [Desulfovibrio desulfuricans]HBW16853.1 hypothetical protein [Desulfovibrio sp.]AAS96098.1 hypothetical protein DVU_1620 [Nitratidesulfovibrio vulgaris str. Hildenborough]ADP86825.1 hypothetical protein Deval_1674 [Nitratidesulfovibrio vulgaris RCH1]WCB48039.1 hypothetical protein PH214_08645 [Nitratidesulfovibrio vulgaris]